LDEDSDKRQRCFEILRRRPVISVQVINEFLSVLLSKRRIDRPAANRLGQILVRRCEVVPITAEVTLQAMYVGERYQISHWDALIVAAALPGPVGTAAGGACRPCCWGQLRLPG
jgi:predicted nucleic acid-binding protein